MPFFILRFILNPCHHKASTKTSVVTRNSTLIRRVHKNDLQEGCAEGFKEEKTLKNFLKKSLKTKYKN
jgi:hypothetical protein